MASKRDMLIPFVQRACDRVLAERVAFLVRTDKCDRAKIIADETAYLCQSIAHEIAQTYSLVELADIIKWRKRKCSDFEKERQL